MSMARKRALERRGERLVRMAHDLADLATDAARDISGDYAAALNFARKVVNATADAYLEKAEKE